MKTIKKTAQFMKILSLILTTLFIFCVTTAHAEPLHKNAWTLKTGYHLFENSDFTDFWGVDNEDLNGFALEWAYERKINSIVGIEFGFGYFGADKTYHNVSFANDSSDIEFRNYYCSPSLKIYLPIIAKKFSIYGGGGLDIYYTQGMYRYSAPGLSSYHIDDDFITPGLHGLAGIELCVYEAPQEDTSSAYMMLFCEYKYSWVQVKDADQKIVDKINSSGVVNLQTHDLGVGGQVIFFGIKFYF